jgi:hypothetical protein
MQPVFIEARSQGRLLSITLHEMCRRALQMVEELSKPKEGSQPIHFDSKYAKGLPAQFKVLLWRNNHVYWRSVTLFAFHMAC